MRNVALAFLALTMAIAASQDVAGLIAALSNLNNATRAEAAALLRERLAADPSLRVDDHGRKFWAKRFAAVRPGMKKAQVLKLLPANAKKELVVGSGQSHLESWRLDSYWTVTVHYTNPDIVAAPPTFTNEAMTIGVSPAADYSGAWVTYYVNGQKHRESQYRSGKLDGLHSDYYENGQKSVEQNQVNGECAGPGTGWYRDGRKMYEGQCVAGKYGGAWTHWREDGTLLQRVEYKDGQFDGVSTFWHPNGQMEREVHYKKGKENGLTRAWDSTGKLLTAVEYTDGRQSTW